MHVRIYAYICIYIHVTTIEIGSRSLKEIKKGYKGGIGGRKGKRKMM